MFDDLLSPLLSLSRVTAIAHRGGAALRPENTMTAFAHAVALGADALECDVHLSRDGEAVVIHDATLDRTTDVTGPVAALGVRELARADAGYRFGAAEGFPFRGKGCGIPTLTDVLSTWPGVPVVVEIKGDRAETAARVLDVVRELGAEHRVIVGGFSAIVLEAVRRSGRRVITSASSVEVQSALRRSAVWLTPRRTGFDLFQVPIRLRGRRVLTRAFVRAARRARVPVQVWIVDDAREMRELVSWGVTGLISDRPDVAIEVRNEN